MKSEVRNIDCMEGMKEFPDKFFDLAIVDPPYGINAANMSMGSNENRSGRDKRGEIQYGSTSVAKRLKKGRLNSGGGHFAGRNLTTMNCDWDLQKPTKEYFTELFRVSKNQVIWGGNYFASNFYDKRCWISWDKIQPWENFSQIELAWTSFDFPAIQIRLSNRGGRNDQEKIHPTQKPISLYIETLNRLKITGGKLLDTHMGSQSSRIAAYDMGFDYWGFELDKDYFEAGCKRYNNHIKQQKLAI